MVNQLMCGDQVAGHWPLHSSALSPHDTHMWSMLEEREREILYTMSHVAEELNQTFRTVLMRHGAFLMQKGVTLIILCDLRQE
jgi:hypothetical protein